MGVLNGFGRQGYGFLIWPLWVVAPPGSPLFAPGWPFHRPGHFSAIFYSSIGILRRFSVSTAMMSIFRSAGPLSYISKISPCGPFMTYIYIKIRFAGPILYIQCPIWICIELHLNITNSLSPVLFGPPLSRARFSVLRLQLLGHRECAFRIQQLK